MLRTWILCLCGTALLCSVAMALTPDGTVKQTVKLVCGFAVLLALLGLFKGFAYPDFSAYISEYKSSAGHVTEEAVETASKSTRFIIEEKCAAYILDKAASMGVGIENASVTARWSDDGYWYPVSAKMGGSFKEEEKLSLSGVIEAELGIPPDEQIWSTDDGS